MNTVEIIRLSGRPSEEDRREFEREIRRMNEAGYIVLDSTDRVEFIPADGNSIHHENTLP